eukprot:11172927-Lingulodinium_polyedra.AAC.1
MDHCGRQWPADACTPIAAHQQHICGRTPRASFLHRASSGSVRARALAWSVIACCPHAWHCQSGACHAARRFLHAWIVAACVRLQFAHRWQCARHGCAAQHHAINLGYPGACGPSPRESCTRNIPPVGSINGPNAH